MKKSFNIKPLKLFLALLVLSILVFNDIKVFNVKDAFSSSKKSSNNYFPIERPANVLRLEESPGTIFNLIQKFGAKPVGNIKETKLKNKETLTNALLRMNFDLINISKIIKSIYGLKNSKKILSSLPVGMIINYSVPSKLTGGALKFNYSKTKDIFVWQDLTGRYISQFFLRPTKFENTFIKGSIDNNLYSSALKFGIPENTLLEIITLLGFSIDFQRDIRSGDSFETMFIKKVDLLKKTVIQTGPINYISITLSGKKLNFFNYRDKQGFSQYYDENGKSSKRTLMKTPINGARLSSRYGNRKHPILGYTKMHRGLDFAAPLGTPVFAAGDGIVEKSGWNGSYGRYIRIRHTKTYKTAYAHLSGIHKNARLGSRVLQGKTIGYVGSSGRSTGPHLHYEVIRNNKKINPMKIKLPSGKNISKAKIADYKKHVKRILVQKTALEKSIKDKKMAIINLNINKKIN